MAPSSSSAHPPEQHFPSEEEDLDEAEEEVQPTRPQDRIFVKIDTDMYTLNSSTRLKGFNMILIAIV